jgi:hypothetical protein
VATDPNCWSCVIVTVGNVPEQYRVRFVSSIKRDGAWKPIFLAEGRSAAMSVASEWTLVTMEVRIKGEWKALCGKLLKKKCPQCRLDHRDPEAPE